MVDPEDLRARRDAVGMLLARARDDRDAFFELSARTDMRYVVAITWVCDNLANLVANQLGVTPAVVYEALAQQLADE